MPRWTADAKLILPNSAGGGGRGRLKLLRSAERPATPYGEIQRNQSALGQDWSDRVGSRRPHLRRYGCPAEPARQAGGGGSGRERGGDGSLDRLLCPG